MTVTVQKGAWTLLVLCWFNPHLLFHQLCDMSQGTIYLLCKHHLFDQLLKEVFFVSKLFSLPNTRFASVYATRGANRIGRVYKKAIFRQFTDDTYSQEIPKAAWLGFLGPVLKAEEEDVFIVHLKNFASRPYSVHPHGVFYDKDSEGKSWFAFSSPFPLE